MIYFQSTITVLFGLWISLASQTWAVEPVTVVSSVAIANCQQPQVAVDRIDNVFVCFGAGEVLYCSSSTDRGQTFGRPKQIDTVSKLALGRRRGPRIVACDNLVAMTAISHESGNILTWVSHDQGVSWVRTTSVNDIDKSAREGLHAMTANADGSLLFCAWLDLRNGKTEIYGGRSTDGGRTWLNSRVYASPSGTVCECCHPSAAIDQAGTVYVMWRNSLDGNRDMYVASSQDGGVTFDEARKLGSGTWRLDACPMDGGAFAVAAPGSFTSIWRRDAQVYTTGNSPSSEQLRGPGEQPVVAITEDRTYFAWLSRRGQVLWLLTPQSPTPVAIATQASDPAISASPMANGPVMLAWEDQSSAERTIQVLDVGRVGPTE